MSDIWVNWRLFYWHMQIGPLFPWLRVTFNRVHVGAGSYWFERYR